MDVTTALVGATEYNRNEAITLGVLWHVRRTPPRRRSLDLDHRHHHPTFGREWSL